VTDDESLSDPTWADTVWAVALLRSAVGALDRLAGRAGAGTVHPELAMALIEGSQSTWRALVALAEAKQLLAERCRRLPLQDAVSDGATAGPADQVQGN
jgi:hypothetical protein